MYVIKRKSIFWALTLILLGTFLCSYGEKNKTNKRDTSKATVATPTSSKVIVVDAGHGIPDERSTK